MSLYPLNKATDVKPSLEQLYFPELKQIYCKSICCKQHKRMLEPVWLVS